MSAGKLDQRSLDVARRQGQCHAARHDRRGRARPGVRRRQTTRTSARRWCKAAAQATLPAGYSIENYYPPKDNYGRDQLFEALGLAVDEGRHRSSSPRAPPGIWRIVNGEWRLFAEGLFDSLGVVVEDGKGLVVVAGQKAELTRISDTNGDGIADNYETLFDAHSYHANYHSYMHGPVRGKDGAYYFALNLVHDGTGSAYTAGGNVMGTWGGFNGWAVRVEPNGKFQLFANGLRSPASLGVGPDGRVWYADNQGDFVGTSKLFELQEGRVLRPSRRSRRSAGHDARFARDQVRQGRGSHARRARRPVPAQPRREFARQSRLGHAATSSVRSPGQMLIGDQTQSNLLRVVMQKVGDVEQGSVMPFFEGLESGVMRPVFLPDGSLLLGQTGRGWQAKGGKVASLQHVRWDGKTVAPQILAMVATPTGFRVDFTQPLGDGVSEAMLRSARCRWNRGPIAMRPTTARPSWICATRGTTAIAVSADRKSLHITLASLEQTTGASAPDRARLSPEARVADAVRCERAGAAQRVLHAAARFPQRRSSSSRR